MTRKIITASREILGGAPVFAGTRVPVQTFIEYIKAGDSLESFLEGFPTVSRQQALAFLRRHASSFSLSFDKQTNRE
jgi:uncharacterized protein (DUF433 family)